MSKMNIKLEDLLERLTSVENSPELISDDDFKTLISEISQALPLSYRIRFDRLSFFEAELDDELYDDDISF